MMRYKASYVLTYRVLQKTLISFHLFMLLYGVSLYVYEELMHQISCFHINLVKKKKKAVCTLGQNFFDFVDLYEKTYKKKKK